MIIRAARPRTGRVIPWLLAGDPSIRWQVLRDLVGAAGPTVERERRNVARDGWGARLLARQDPEGTWAGQLSPDGGLYSPKWVSTTYTMLLLRDLGLPSGNRQARKACARLLDGGLRRDGGVSYGTWARWTGRSETCVTGMVLSILSHFEHDDDRLDTIAEHLLERQMPDGGWNCRRPEGATHASMHTTISALEGLRLYERHRGGAARAVRAAQRRGREFLLTHRLFRSHRTGEIIKPAFTRFSFPPRWHYDILRALDHFQAVDAPRDPRLAEAVDIVRSRQGKDGRWPLENRYPGRTYFELERLRAPSRWNTLRALRVLKWWGPGLTAARPPRASPAPARSPGRARV
ncbi:MAG TPA: prenyltransferase/squalene oxidase repeat-containing protein [Vicinamibacteria bacterium]